MVESCLRDFKDLKLIGKGSFGRVYRCIRVSDGLEYAMKEVAIKAMSQREREDAVNEVRILASVTHSMVIRCELLCPVEELHAFCTASSHLISMFTASKCAGAVLFNVSHRMPRVRFFLGYITTQFSKAFSSTRAISCSEHGRCYPGIRMHVALAFSPCLGLHAAESQAAIL